MVEVSCENWNWFNSKNNGKMEPTHAQLGFNYLSVTNIF
ncbi:Uncharacterised protein [Legionella oakridgensis]|nr:Uncharacterised protein [Legionella oakridgensis]